MRPGAGQQVRLPDLQRGASLAEATTGDPSAPCFTIYIAPDRNLEYRFGNATCSPYSVANFSDLCKFSRFAAYMQKNGRYGRFFGPSRYPKLQIGKVS